MSEAIFLNQAEARAYIAAIADPTARLLTEAATSRAISVWVADPEQRESLVKRPIDLLAFARALHVFFGDKRILEEILAGKLTTLEDISNVF